MAAIPGMFALLDPLDDPESAEPELDPESAEPELDPVGSATMRTSGAVVAAEACVARAVTDTTPGTSPDNAITDLRRIVDSDFIR
ncbi:hypothetical protein [Nocardia sp. GAS34]|uniref:hypothetical protein n=1 Tax=unclassified Nocardia TaxID=2637762 RepID=UPI003D20C9FC